MRCLLASVVLLIIIGAEYANAQVLVVNDDEFGIPFAEPLLVEAFGVLDNDTLGGENAGEGGATAELVQDVSHGTLVFNSDGSFSYTPGLTFDGIDEFVYRARFDTQSGQATVRLSACSGGPQIFTCWSETAFLAKAAESGYATFLEGFEDEGVWGSVRTPFALPSVSSRGIRWQSNHPDPPASNLISTTPGPPHTGQWAVYDPDHGYATGSELECDVDEPDPHCLYNDGWTGIREAGLRPLHGVGGFVDGIFGANVVIVLDGGLPIGGGRVGSGHQFFGAIDTSPTGFTQFEFREIDGKVGQALFIWGDDFTLVTPAPTAVREPTRTRVLFAGAAPNPSGGSTSLRFSLTARAAVRLDVYDSRGRLVHELLDDVRGPGTHEESWDGRDRNGQPVSAGIYYGRLLVGRDGAESALTRKIVVLH